MNPRVHHSTTPWLPRMPSSSSGLRPSRCLRRCPGAADPCAGEASRLRLGCRRDTSPFAWQPRSRPPWPLQPSAELLHGVQNVWPGSEDPLCYPHECAAHAGSCCVNWLLVCLRRVPSADSWRESWRAALPSSRPSWRTRLQVTSWSAVVPNSQVL